jgi:hypothetical protein
MRYAHGLQRHRERLHIRGRKYLVDSLERITAGTGWFPGLVPGERTTA